MTEPAEGRTAHFGSEGDAGWGLTPSQTVGPFFHYMLSPGEHYPVDDLVTGAVATPDAAGQRIRIEGQVLDGNGEAIVDALVEIWQPDGEGRFSGRDAALANAAFTGFGRCALDQTGHFAFNTVKPGPVPGPDGRPQAPHVSLGIFARGLLRRLHTRLYFEDEGDANAADPVLALVPQARRGTLLAKRQDRPTETVYRFEIVLQGENETVFFDV